VSGDYLSDDAPVSPVTTGSRAEAVVEFVKSKVGLAYIWGGTGPNGYDCSGLTYMAYASIGVSLPRTADAQAGVGVPVTLDEIEPGDLVFYYSPISHVAMYVGDGQVVHASTYGVGVVYGDVQMTTITAIRRML
jgi:cell wall-associated NlpC family hydrolase